MATADFSSILESLDTLSANEQAQLSAILAAKTAAQLSPTRVNHSGAIDPGINKSDSDWDDLAPDPQLAGELAAIDGEFSAVRHCLGL